MFRQSLADHGIVTRRPIEVVNWTNEEGARFAPPMAAARVFAGEHDVAWLHDLRDDDGISMRDELERIGYLGTDPANNCDIDSYFELHIEQGPLLEQANTQLGIVAGGYTAYGLNVRFHGTNAHSGPTAMADRSNALVGAAKFINAVNDIGWKYAPTGKSTATRLIVWPNKPGILPSLTDVSVDMRHSDPKITDQMRIAAHRALSDAGAAAMVGFEIVSDWTFGDVTFDPGLTSLVRRTADDLGVSTMDILSQAGHDAYCVAAVAPAILLFSPCVRGISHNESEDIVPNDTWPSVNVLLHAVLRRAERP